MIIYVTDQGSNGYHEVSSSKLHVLIGILVAFFFTVGVIVLVAKLRCKSRTSSNASVMTEREVDANLKIKEQEEENISIQGNIGLANIDRGSDSSNTYQRAPDVSYLNMTDISSTNNQGEQHNYNFFF